MTTRPHGARKAAVNGGETMKSLRTAIRVLMEFAGEQRDYGVGELAQRCGLSKSHVSKILDAFAGERLLAQDDETRRYSVGVRCYALGSRFLTHDRLCRAAMPVMRDLVDRTAHSARLSVLDGEHALYLMGLEGPLFVDTGWRSGTWLPVHSTSAGRVLLAFMDPQQAESLLARQPLRRVTERTVVDLPTIRRLLNHARNKGYASQRGETTPGLGTVAVPIFATGQAVIGTLGLAFPAHLVQTKDEPRLANILHQSARTLSQRMGSTVYPFGHDAPGEPAGAGEREIRRAAR